MQPQIPIQLTSSYQVIFSRKPLYHQTATLQFTSICSVIWLSEQPPKPSITATILKHLHNSKNSRNHNFHKKSINSSFLSFDKVNILTRKSLSVSISWISEQPVMTTSTIQIIDPTELKYAIRVQQYLSNITTYSTYMHQLVPGKQSRLKRIRIRYLSKSKPRPGPNKAPTAKPPFT